ncbi:ABC transporter permease [Natrononativus amylolyticus]|uniref:ABC transporter permease n=1 Tax=Natrononativus amylolyticus TaxID=2963434 RepID=UPI0020CE82F6|nr:ABC transporter permease [Natrononativus amylolyticus]
MSASDSRSGGPAVDLDPDSVIAVARKDFHDAARSKVLWLLTTIFVAFLGGMAFLFVYLDDLLAQEGEEIAAVSLILFLEQPVAWLLPLIGLLVGYKSLAGEIDSGTGKILFSLPHSRLDVVVGKFLGRSLVLWAALFAGLAVAFVIIVALYDEVNAFQLFVFSLLSLLLGTVFVGIGVAISSLTTSTGKAAAGVVGVFIFFYFVFDSFRLVAYYLLTGNVFPEPPAPGWYLFVPRLNPMGAYDGALYGLLPDATLQEIAFWHEGELPFYLSDWFAVLILLAWLVVPVALGYLRFRNLDL